MLYKNITSIWPKILSNQPWSRIVHFWLQKAKNYLVGKQETYLKRHASVQLLFPRHGAEQHNSTGSCSTCTALPDLHFHKQNSLWAHFIISCRLLKTLPLKLRSFFSHCSTQTSTGFSLAHFHTAMKLNTQVMFRKAHH